MTLTLDPPRPKAAEATAPRRRRRNTPPNAHGEPSIWLTGGALVLALVSIVGLLGYVLVRGAQTFWPTDLVLLKGDGDEAWLGEVVASEAYIPEPHVVDSLTAAERERLVEGLAAGEGRVRRRMIAIGNFELTGNHHEWVSGFEVVSEERPEWALQVERLEWQRFQGFPRAFEVDGEAVAEAPAAVWEAYNEHFPAVQERRAQRRGLERHEVGALNARQERERLRVRGVELEHGRDSEPWRAAQAELERVEAEVGQSYAKLRGEIDLLDAENARYQLVLETSRGEEQRIPLDQVVRTIPTNRLGFFGRLGVYLARWKEFLLEDPREDGGGGVYPAIFGTVVMTLIMSIFVVPLGVLAALYLREYAKQGPLVSAVRIAVNNLAGVPSIVFGVFGLGFFCYLMGSSIDELLFATRLPNPTFGKGGVLWASLTLALLTLPVVVVSSEEALSAVPGSMREGSYACGATKWQTIRRIVLPRAMPGIMTGMILAVARGAGEVAPLMLVGAAKLASELPVDGQFPFFHGSRAFMHLGFHIYDLGFQSQNSEAAKPMVFTTTLLLIAIVVALNLSAIAVRTRLRRKFVA